MTHITAPARSQQAVLVPAGRRLWGAAALWRFVRRKPLGALGLIILLALAVLTVGAPLFTSRNPTLVYAPLSSPSGTYLFGTDGLGRDVFTRVLYGGRVSLAVAFASVAISITAATALGTLSGYLGGWIDLVVQRVVDVLMALPWLIVLLSLRALMGAGIVQLIIAIAFLSSASATRIVVSAVSGIRANAYFEAARATGAGPLRIVLRYILPNIFAPVMIVATLALGNVILTETALSFLGYGIPPPNPSWGRMLGPDAKGYLVIGPWIAIFPGVAISLSVFAFNMLGDALRDVLDPRLRLAGK